MLPGSAFQMTKHDLPEYERQAEALAEGASAEARDALRQLIGSMEPALDALPAPMSSGWSQTLMALGAGLAIYAVYLPIALWLGSGYVSPSQPSGRVVETLLRIDPYGGFMWRARSYGLGDYADADATNQRSPIIVYENLTPLGPGHANSNDIALIGRGRFTHSKSGRPGENADLLFSTSDNSDPRTNGRKYWAVLP